MFGPHPQHPLQQRHPGGAGLGGGAESWGWTSPGQEGSRAVPAVSLPPGQTLPFPHCGRGAPASEPSRALSPSGRGGWSSPSGPCPSSHLCGGSRPGSWPLSEREEGCHPRGRRPHSALPGHRGAAGRCLSPQRSVGSQTKVGVGGRQEQELGRPLQSCLPRGQPEGACHGEATPQS